tara:strand:+ start:3535 stop:3723 length:189 start_codon:yes stop_codon:yes gene_type:complete
MGVLAMTFLSWLGAKITASISINLYATASILYDVISMSIIVAYGLAASLSILVFLLICLDYF